MGYDFKIIYKKGKQNMLVDALSIKDENVKELLHIISIMQVDWLVETRIEWKNCQKVWILIQYPQKDPIALDKFVWKNDSLWYKDCLYIRKNSQLK